MIKFYLAFLSLISFSALGQTPSGYYDMATASGYSLKTQLHTIIDEEDDGNGQPSHDTSTTYGQLWALYETSDVKPDGSVWDMYSDCNYDFDVDQDRGTGGNVECDVFNREHTFPRSWFGGDTDLAIFTDAFHVVPTDKKVNSIRGNFAFGEVATANYTSLNGSQRGGSSIAGPTGEVFEPIDQYKGDIARGLFYIATRYQDQISGWETNDTDGDSMLDGSNDKVFEQWALDMLYRWHSNDPVDQKEIDRNNAIFAHQGNRNPFIDNPGYVQQIWQNTLGSQNFTRAPEFKIYPNPVSSGFVYITSTTNTSVKIYNVLGKLVGRYEITPSDNDINVSKFSNGVYLVKMQSANQTMTQRLIIR